MPGIIGKKIGMTRLLQDDGRVIPITVVNCAPNTVTQVKTADKDGYPAVVLGFSALKKPTKNKKFHTVKEFRVEANNELKPGDLVNLDLLKDISEVSISGVSKGKGFQGVVKRYHFAGGPASHGSHHHREPGSIGARSKPGRVHKGKRMAGRMGQDRKTLHKVKVMYLNAKENLLGLKGPLPGSNNSIIYISF